MPKFKIEFNVVSTVSKEVMAKDFEDAAVQAKDLLASADFNEVLKHNKFICTPVLSAIAELST